MKKERVQHILTTIEKIKMSELSVNTYFTVHDVPFSRSQYYTYCHILKQYGEEGLRDKRHDGNSTKLTQRIEDYMLFILKQEPEISTRELRQRVSAEFTATLSKSRVNMFRSVHGYIGTRPTKRIPHKPQRSGGGEIVTGLALCSGILDVFTHTIMEQIQEIRQSDTFRHNQQKPKDHPKIRAHGKFTTAYNQLQSVRENRLKSIDEKISSKNYASMNLFRLSEKSLSRYHLALLCLPLVTSNGKISRVNRVRGNDLTFLCGYNYKDATLDKYLRELKYLKVAEKLVAETAKFWMRFWKERYDEETFFVCYYIDGNTKALWSSERHYKGKVTMLGRVMNCLENVFIHDGKGHPLYFQTFHGHADLGKHALAMLTELTNSWEESITVTRILVIDGAGNSVKTMRAFQKSEEYFITILDKNQVNERRVKHLGADQPYPYGEATISDCRIELQDSSESGYLYESRAVMVKWEHGRQSVLVTNIPCELVEASDVVKRYFDRWPMQEKQFRDAKSGVHIHRIVGYGKQAEPYEKMREKCQKLREAIRHLQEKLHAPLAEIARIEEELALWYAKERPLREQSTIEDGKRILCDAKLAELKQCERHINACLRKKRAIKKPYKADFTQLHNYLKEEARLCRKDTVYRLDTELDQIMTCFKLSFVNLCSLFLTECLNHETFELLTLFESIFHLEGQALITETEKIITLQHNPKEPELMKKLKVGLGRLNEMNISNLDGLRLKFCM